MSKKAEKTKITRISASDSDKSSDKKASKTAIKSKTKVKSASSKKGVDKETTSKKEKKLVTEKVKNSTQTTKKKRRITAKKVAETSIYPAKSFGGYLKNSWIELKKVIWPDRGATWSMTGALIIFTGFFLLLITLLDYLFKAFFNYIIG